MCYNIILYVKLNDKIDWGELNSIVRQYSVYDPDDPAVKELLHQMAQSKIELISTGALPKICLSVFCKNHYTVLV